MSIRAVAIDIDGTLSDESRNLHLGAIRKIREIEARGIPVILATGNILCISEAASFFIGTSGPLIVENGGIIKTKSQRAMYLTESREINKAYQHLSKSLNVKKVARSELRKTEIAIYRTLSVEKIKDVLKNFNVEVVDTKFAIHIKDPGVNKGKALALVAKDSGLTPDQIVAIGDSENDREMLQFAGYSISVGEEKLNTVCDYVTKGSAGKGGEEALKRVLSITN
jgi:hypothetical protein|tara:strand:+ start:6614 stop:7288 length:675 start_codon:yes stop_codon:yes gene_type:complete